MVLGETKLVTLLFRFFPNVLCRFLQGVWVFNVSGRAWPAIVTIFVGGQRKQLLYPCLAFCWIPTSLSSCSYMEVWHRCVGISGIALTAACDLPRTLRENDLLL